MNINSRWYSRPDPGAPGGRKDGLMPTHGARERGKTRTPAQSSSFRHWTLWTTLVGLGCGSDPLPLPPNPYVDAGPCASLDWDDMQRDPANCGSCGNVCSTGARCVSGTCASGPDTVPYTLCSDDARRCNGACVPTSATPSLCLPPCSFGNDCPASPPGSGITGVCLFDTGYCGIACGPGGACPHGLTCGTETFRVASGYTHLCMP